MPLPKINIDDFNRNDMFAALRDYGTYEIVGPSVDALMVLAREAHAVAKHILTLPLEKLQQHSAEDFNGFEDVRGKTLNSKTLRNQIAFHYKPYRPRKIPAEIDITPLEKFYKAEHALLVRHYNQIQDAFIPEKMRIKVLNTKGDEKKDDKEQFDEKSVLMMRRYFKASAEKKSENKEQATTGIPAHSDHGRLTFVISDQPGLEVFYKGKWIPANDKPGINQCVANYGDWTMLRCQEEAILEELAREQDPSLPVTKQRYPFEAGLHRVPEVNEERISMSLSLNPPVEELAYNMYKQQVKFGAFLQSPKAAHRDTSRDESATQMANEQDELRPKVQLPVPKNTPTLYVFEKTDRLQQNWLMVRGNGPVLSPETVIGDKAKSAHGFSYAYPSIEAAKNTNLPNVCDDDPSCYEIHLKNAADIYVVDESVFDKNRSLDEVAKTAIALADYKNQFKEPVYLIQRALLNDEAEMTYENTLTYKA